MGAVGNYLKGSFTAEPTEVRSRCETCGGTGTTEYSAGPTLYRQTCSVCNGSGVRVGQAGCLSELFVRLFVVIGGSVLLLLVALITVAVPAQLWVQAVDPLRSIMEALPLGSLVAEEPSDDGNPIVIGVLTGLPVIAALIALTRWRRQLVRRHLDAVDQSLPTLMGASLVRSLVFLVFGTLVAVLATIASGADLESDFQDDQLRPGVVLIAIAAVGWVGLTWYGFRRLVRRLTKKAEKEARRQAEDAAAT